MTWIILVAGGFLLAPILIGKVGLGLTWAFQSLVNLFAPILISLAVVTFLLFPILGERGGKVIVDLWVGLLKTIGKFVKFLLDLIIHSRPKS